MDLLAWLDASPTPWHAASVGAAWLERVGFQDVPLEQSPWERRGIGAFVRTGGLLVAWKWPSTLESLRLGSAHTDSPCLRLKPRPERRGPGTWSLGVEVYGGALLHTWMDRPLEIAGRVQLANGQECLIRLTSPKPVLPSLAIHLDREVNEKGPQLNRELHLPVLAGLESSEWSLKARLAQQLDCQEEDILASELCVIDAQPAVRLGMDGELLQSGRLDNLASCHALLAGLLHTAAPTGTLPLVALFDGEEIGSEIRTGARSQLFSQILERIALTMGIVREPWLAMLARSAGLSADMAHAVHPNHPGKHDHCNAPLLGLGPVLKTNASYRYATDAPAAGLLRQAARKSGVPLQDFAMRADLGCGSTVGPALASSLGIAVVDCGAPMLAMHSSRELIALADHVASIALYQAFLEG
jgi:aspartyl aminopeptidase